MMWTGLFGKSCCAWIVAAMDEAAARHASRAASRDLMFPPALDCHVAVRGFNSFRGGRRKLTGLREPAALDRVVRWGGSSAYWRVGSPVSPLAASPRSFAVP